MHVWAEICQNMFFMGWLLSMCCVWLVVLCICTIWWCRMVITILMTVYSDTVDTQNDLVKARYRLNPCDRYVFLLNSYLYEGVVWCYWGMLIVILIVIICHTVDLFWYKHESEGLSYSRYLKYNCNYPCYWVLTVDWIVVYLALGCISL